MRPAYERGLEFYRAIIFKIQLPCVAGGLENLGFNRICKGKSAEQQNVLLSREILGFA